MQQTHSNRCKLILGFCISLGLIWNVDQQAKAQDFDTQSLPPGAVYYDAEQVRLEGQGNKVRLIGKVLFLYGDSFIKAEELLFDRASGLAVAEGNVRILRDKQRLEASRMVADTTNQEAYLTEVRLVVDPKLPDETIDTSILGITKAEVAFEAERGARQRSLESELKTIRDEYVSIANLLEVYRDEVRKNELLARQEKTKRRYAQILGRLTRTKYQPNLFLQSLEADQKERLLARRKSVAGIVAANKAKAGKLASFENMEGYLALTAKTLYQDTEGNLKSENAALTPCRCDAEDIPIWGLSAADSLIEPNQYATLYGATVDIGSVPVFYLPYFKFPIKNKRESGFLLPTIYVSRSGEVVSIPYFQTLGEHADATVTFDNFSGKGPRVGAEFRGKLTRSAQVRLDGEYTEDQKRVDNFDRLKIENAIDKEFKSKAVEANEFKQNIGEVRAERWKTSGDLNLPYSNLAAIKGHWTFISDNRYLSDYSVETESKSDLFTPAQSTYRFLTQEASAEYYGSRFGLSLRVQTLQDVLEASADKTPKRYPKIEFAYFPLQIFELPLFFDQTATWETVERDNPENFVDLYSTVSVPTGNTGGPSRKPTIQSQPDGVRTPNEPYITGQRLAFQSRLSGSLLSNKYINSTASARGFASAYMFEAEAPLKRLTTRMGYVSYELENESKLSLSRRFQIDENGSSYLEVNSIVEPFANLDYLPKVDRDPLFPGYYDVFYEADNEAPKKEITFGINSRFSIAKYSLQKGGRSLNRLTRSSPPSPANLRNLAKVRSNLAGKNAVEISETEIPTINAEELFLATKSTQFSNTLIDWADAELEEYKEAVRKDEFNQRLQWTSEKSYLMKKSWSASPLQLGLSTSYNFGAEETRENIESRLNRGQLVKEVDPWGDVVLSAKLNGNPWLPITASSVSYWNPLKKRINEGVTSTSVTFPFRLTLGYSNSYENFDVGNPERVTFVKRTIGYSADYLPVPWLKFTFQRKATSNTQDVDPPPIELQYESLQKITLVNLQDCLDIELKRFKKKTTIEKNAEWSIGLNLKFLGQERPISNIGESVNRSIQNRNF